MYSIVLCSREYYHHIVVLRAFLAAAGALVSVLVRSPCAICEHRATRRCEYLLERDLSERLLREFVRCSRHGDSQGSCIQGAGCGECVGFTFHGTHTEGQRGEQWGRDGSDESASSAPEEPFVLDHRPPIPSGERRARG